MWSHITQGVRVSENKIYAVYEIKDCLGTAYCDFWKAIRVKRTEQIDDALHTMKDWPASMETKIDGDWIHIKFKKWIDVYAIYGRGAEVNHKEDIPNWVKVLVKAETVVECIFLNTNEHLRWVLRYPHKNIEVDEITETLLS